MSKPSAPAGIRGWDSLKIQLALASTAMFVVVVLLLTSTQVYLIRQSLRATMGTEQTSLVNREAAEIDDKLGLRRATLTRAAANVTPESLESADQARQKLAELKPLLALFDDILLLSATGRVLADLPVVPQRVNRDFSRIDFIVRVLATGKPVISAPLLGVTTRQPLIVIAVPILGADGKVIGMLNGTIDLLRPNFLGGLANAKIGKTGYFYILTKEARPIVVIHPRQDSILGAAPGPAENPSTARALAGFEGTLEGTNSAGMRGLFSYKSLTEVNWLLAAVLPADEAFGQIGEIETKIRNAMLFISLLLAPLIWWVAYRRLRPLEALRANIQELRREPHRAGELEVQSRDEIGALTQEFNDLIRERRIATDALIASEERFRTITDNLPVLVGYVDRDLRYRFNNLAYEEWFGVDRDALIGLTMRELLE